MHGFKFSMPPWGRVLLVGLGLNCAGASARAADWPPRPSTVVDKACSEVPEARVCVLNHLGRNLPQLEIVYRGYLAAAEAETDRGGVVAWLSLNDRTGFFHMALSQGQSAYNLTIGAPTSETPCIIKASPEVMAIVMQFPWGSRDAWPSCPPETQGQAGEGSWIVVGPPDGEAFLLEGVHDPSGKPLAWNLEAAFASVDGRRWDSKYGRNYRFTFGAEQPSQNE